MNGGECIASRSDTGDRVCAIEVICYAARVTTGGATDATTGAISLIVGDGADPLSAAGLANGGAFTASAGDGNSGGAVSIMSGAGIEATTGVGGDMTLSAGASAGGKGGDITIQTGASTFDADATGAGGDLTLTASKGGANAVGGSRPPQPHSAF